MSIALNTGLRSLLTAQFALETLGHNIANANTPGYSRQKLNIATEMPVNLRGLVIGNGVKTTSVERTVDALLNRRIVRQVAVTGRLESQLTGMTEVEAMLGELDGRGIGSLLDDLFTSVSELSTNPEDSILRSGVGQAALALSSQFNSISSGMTNLQRDTAAELDTRVEEVNLLASDILELNEEIARAEAAGVAANDLRDRRELAFEELSRRVDATAVEESNGAMRVLVAGNTLVSSSRVYELGVAEDVGGDPRLTIEGAKGFVPVTGGSIGGLLDTTSRFIPQISSELDDLARNLILEFNRVHSTGVPSSGSFHSLTGSESVVDLDQDGKLEDELLANSGLPFEVTNGELRVSINDEETGKVTRHTISISSTHTTVGDLLESLSDIPHLSADLSPFGRIQLVADGGYTFDFSPKLDPNPNDAGTFGGGKASVGTAQGPFQLPDGATLNLTAPAGGTPLSIPFFEADFEDINAATADEIAAVINANTDAQTAGINATAIDGSLFLQTAGEGPTASFTIDGGSALGGLGLGALAGSTITGHENSVGVAISGSYQGDGTDVFRFVPNMDGVVGTTPGLQVDVFDASGNQVASLDVGEGYTPDEKLSVGQGIEVSFGLGELSATHGDLFAVDVVDDSDTSDVLVALGVNSLFTGTGAADIALREDIETDPGLIATSLTGTSGDNRLLLDLLDLQNASVEGLGSVTLGQSYGDTIGEFGFELSSTLGALESNGALLASLDQLKQSVSGVNVDEELVDMVRFEQAFQAASQYISVVNGLQDDLLSIL
ncbi:MAG: flagellar hook-associated protein FlgK [Planctomycetota bacterium]